MPRDYDAGSRFEEEGIPDLQEGTPEQQWASDPQEAPVPGDEPAAVDEWGTTVREQAEGEPLDLRLEREEADSPGPDRSADTPGNLYDPTSEHAGRLVAPDEGTRPDDEPTMVADDVGADGGGYGPEERAMHVEPELGSVPDEGSARTVDERR